MTNEAAVLIQINRYDIRRPPNDRLPMTQALWRLKTFRISDRSQATYSEIEIGGFAVGILADSHRL